MFVLGISCMKLRAHKHLRDCEFPSLYSECLLSGIMIDRGELGGMRIGLCVALIALWQL
jgi:hypothetical protein